MAGVYLNSRRNTGSFSIHESDEAFREKASSFGHPQAIVSKYLHQRIWSSKSFSQGAKKNLLLHRKNTGDFRPSFGREATKIYENEQKSNENLATSETLVRKKVAQCPIAVIGIGCRMPGDVNTSGDFWKVISEGRSTITEVPPERWSIASFYSPDPLKPGHTVSKWGSFVDGVEKFDNKFFRISPREAAMMDPQQRILLEVSYEAFQDAGIVVENSKLNCGVYVGIGMMDYPILIGSDKNIMNSYTHTGTAHSVAANRISYTFDFYGPSVAIDTACASSMTAAHIACSGLRNDECRLALVAGSNLNLLPEVTIGFSKLGVLSSDGKSCPFDERANGYVRSEGWGAVILKRLDHAILDGDHVYSVIRGSTIADNGASGSLTMPSSEAQERLMRETYAKSGIPLVSVQYIEAHGTSTPVGDPLEAKAIGNVFGKSRSTLFPIKIGSVKSNFGHMECAAGIAAIIKSALMLKNRLLCPSINFQKLNPNIDGNALNMEVQKTVHFFGKKKFTIGVNSFGFGGALAHMIMEEAAVRPKKNHSEAGWKMCEEETRGLEIMIPLSAKSLISLHATVEKWANFDYNMDAMAVAGWQATRRAHHDQRVVIIADSKSDFNEKCRLFLDDEESPLIVKGERKWNTGQKQKVCFVFPGSGQQYATMGRTLYATEAVFKNTVDLCDEYFKKYSGFSFIEHTGVFRGDLIVSIDDIEVSQPAIIFFQLAIVELLKNWGVRADIVVGHSLGEISAAYTAGSLSLEESILLTYFRCREQSKLKGIGAMAASVGDGAVAEEISNSDPDIDVACFNAPRMVTIAGPSQTIKSIVERHPTQFKQLRVDSAFHTKYMEPIKASFIFAIKSKLRKVRPRGSVAFYSTITGDRYQKSLGDEYWWDNIRKPVQFMQAIQRINNNHEVQLFLEIGASHTLLSYIQKSLQVKEKNPLVLGLGSRKTDDRTNLLQTIAKLYVLGFPLVWDNITRKTSSYAPLPFYGWHHQSHWTEPKEREQLRLGYKQTNTFRENDSLISLDSFPFFKDHVVENKILFPATGYIELTLQVFGDENQLPYISGIEFSSPTIFPESGSSKNEVQFRYEKEDSKISLYNPNGLASVMTLESNDQCDLGHLSYSEIKHRCHEKVMKTEDFYRFLTEYGFKYGQEFQVVEKIFRGDEEAISFLSAALDQYQRFNIMILDGMFQTSFSAAIDYLRENCTYLPVSIKSIKFSCDKLPLDQNFVVWAKVTESEQDYVQCNIKLCHPDDGLVYIEVENLKLQYLGGHQTVPFYSECLYKTVWQPVTSSLPSFTTIRNQFSQTALEQKYPEETRLVKKVEDILPLIKKICLAFIKHALEAAQNPKENRYYQHLKKIRIDSGDSPMTAFEANNLLLALQRSHRSFELELSLLLWLGDLLPQTLQDSKDAVKVLFSERGLNRYFMDSLSTRIFYKILRDVTHHAVKESLKKKELVKILEIGGRMGGLATYVLEPIEEYLHNGSIEYTFTDLHSTFFPHAKTILAKYPQVKFKLLDIEKNIQIQDFMGESYDIIICMDTLHSVVDVSDSLYNITDLLVGNGWLLLMEATNTHLISEVVFGCLELCWTYNDDYRHDGCWLTKDEWMNVLEENNDLVNTSCLTTKNEFFHTIFAAQKKSYVISNDHLLILYSNLPMSLHENLCTSYVGKSSCLEFNYFLKQESAETDQSTKLIFMLPEDCEAIGQVHKLVQFLINKKISNFITGIWIITLRGTEAPYSSSIVEGYMRSVVNELPSIPLHSCIIYETLSDEEKIKGILEALQISSYPEIKVTSAGLLVSKLMPLNLVPEEEEITSDSWVLNYDGEETNFVSLLREELAESEVRVRVKCAGVNFKDVMTFRGLLDELDDEIGSQFGIECSGIVEEVGVNVKHFKEGDEVIALGNFCFSTHVITDSNLCVKKPKSMSWEQAAGVAIAHITAYHALVERGMLKENEIVLIHSAAGGVGLAAVNIAKLIGAEVFATVGTEEKQRYLQENYQIPYISDSHSFKCFDDVKRWTNGRGVDVVLNSLAGKFIKAGMDCLAPGGRFLEIGKRDFLQNHKVDLRPLLENKTFSSVQMDFLMKGNSSKIQQLLQTILSLFDNEDFYSIPTQANSVFKYKEILTKMSSGSHIGKVVLSIPKNPSTKCIKSKPVLFNSNGNYIITGGLGGIGQHFLKWMVKEGAQNITVITKRGCNQFGSRARTLKWLADRGVNLHVIKADLLSIDYSELFKEIEVINIPVKGIIHLAGDIQNSATKDIELEAFWKCINIKALSALQLHKASLHQNLDFFITLSSVASTWGNPEQAAYVSANNCMDELMIYRRKIGLPGLSLQFGAVDGAGYLLGNKRTTKITNQKGMLPLHINEYLTILSSILRNGHQSLPPVITITNSDWEKTLNFCSRSKQRISHLCSFVNERPDNTRYTEKQLQNNVCEKLSDLLELPYDEIDIRVPLTDFGVDSLIAVELVNWIKKQFGITISQLDILGGMTTKNLLQKALVGETCLPTKRSC